MRLNINIHRVINKKLKTIIKMSSQLKTKISPTDPKAIMAKIRAEVEANKDKLSVNRPAPKMFDSTGSSGAYRGGEILHSKELRYINENHAYPFGARVAIDNLKSHRPGLIGSFVTKIKRKVLSILWDSFLSGYFEQEKEYQSNLVRLLNQFAKYVDDRDGSNFWEIIKKIDYDVQKCTTRIDRAIDEFNGNLYSTEKRISENLFGELKTNSQILGELQGSLEKIKNQVGTLDSVTGGLEALASKGYLNRSVESGVESSDSQMNTVKGENSKLPDPAYLLLENKFRGSQDLIRGRLSIYPELFKDSKLPILEIGAGRGELQKLFKENNIKSIGIDMDASMADAAKDSGEDIILGDGMQYLRSQPDKSLGGVIAIQVVEHLTWDQLNDLFNLCTKKVITGGKVIFETINPKSVLALSSNYFRDPTHKWPMHPDTMSFWMGLHGIKTAEIRYLSPVADSAKLKKLHIESGMGVKWEQFIEEYNFNVDRVNEVIYGDQDYAIIGIV